MAYKAIENPPPQNGSVVKQPPLGSYGFDDFVFQVASLADDIPAWGTSWATRDRLLREFWPTEPMFASAIFNTVARYAAFGYQIEGPNRVAAQYDKMLNQAEHGKGWHQFITKILLDAFTQDNGAFIEYVRTEDSPTAPVIGMNQLDAGQCFRTGVRDTPVIYYDMYGLRHALRWYQVAEVTEFPSPIERMRGLQYCCVTRMLRAAQIMRDISIYKREKLSGRFNRAVHLVSGVHTKTIQDALATQGLRNDAAGLMRFTSALIIGSLDPTARVSKETIELASLPDGFDMEKELRAYIMQLALAFGGDYQDFAPLPGGGLGSGASSQVMSVRARGKGPKLFMSTIEQLFNYHGVFPTNLQFKYGDQDASEDLDKTKLRTMRAEERAIRIKSLEISPAVARQLAVDDGDLPEEYLAQLAEYDLTPAVQGPKDLDEGEARGSSGVRTPTAHQDDGSASNAI